jgi:hypothetical protein
MAGITPATAADQIAPVSGTLARLLSTVAGATQLTAATPRTRAIKVINNSYGPTGGGTFDPNSATVHLQRVLAAEGVVTVWANGNDGGDGSANLSNPPGQDPTPGIISVASSMTWALGRGTARCRRSRHEGSPPRSPAGPTFRRRGRASCPHAGCTW